MRSNRERKRQALVKRPEIPPYEDLSATHPMTYDSYVLFGHHAEYKTDSDHNVSASTDMFVYAPADSELAKSSAAIPLLAPMLLLPIAMGLIGKFAIGDPTLTMILVVLGLAVGTAVGLYLVWRRTATSRVSAPAAETSVPTIQDPIVVIPTEVPPPAVPTEVSGSPTPEAVNPLPGAETETGTEPAPQA